MGISLRSNVTPAPVIKDFDLWVTNVLDNRCIPEVIMY